MFVWKSIFLTIFLTSSYEIGRFLKFEDLKYGMCARKYSLLGHQTEEKRNDVISSYEVRGPSMGARIRPPTATIVARTFAS